jgi:hypothetical protein
MMQEDSHITVPMRTTSTIPVRYVYVGELKPVPYLIGDDMAVSATAPVSMTAEHAEALVGLGALAIPWATIWAWLQAYGWPLLLQLLAVLLPLLKAGKFPSMAELVAYAEQVLAALKAGQPIPTAP